VSHAKWVRIYPTPFALRWMKIARAACDVPMQRETNADILRNRTPVGDRTQVLPVEFKNRHVVGFAEARRTLDDNLQHGLEFGWRSADDFKNLRCRPLLFKRLVTLARATSVSRSGTGAPRPRTFGTLRGFGVTVLRRRAVASLLPALERRLIAFPVAQDKAR
jgi:hypothetical protein